jgi:hypothetical protein
MLGVLFRTLNCILLCYKAAILFSIINLLPVRCLLCFCTNGNGFTQNTRWRLSTRTKDGRNVRALSQPLRHSRFPPPLNSRCPLPLIKLLGGGGGGGGGGGVVGGCVKHEPQEFLPGQDLLHHPHSFMGKQGENKEYCGGSFIVVLNIYSLYVSH